VVTMLHLSGATDGFIARQFQAASPAWRPTPASRRPGRRRGGRRVAPARPGPDPDRHAAVQWTDLAAPLPCPFIAALVAAVTARLTAEAALRRMP